MKKHRQNKLRKNHHIVYALLLTVCMIILDMKTMHAQEKVNEPGKLSIPEKQLVKISALTASGDSIQLKAELANGLSAGLKINEIKEALVQLYAYCGFPRSLNAINTFKTVIDERAAKGIKDAAGEPGETENKTKDRYEQGRKVLEQLTKTPQSKPAPGFGEFAPRIDAFLKEHLFADIFHNKALNNRQRELVTIAALTATPGAEAQVKAHVGMGKNVEITVPQLIEMADVVEDVINISQANTLRTVLEVPLHAITAADMMVRISEIEIVPGSLEKYLAILKEESVASVKIEKGVVAIFPMMQKEHPEQIRIIEIYANRKAYENHLLTPHFKAYKSSTMSMVKSLKLVDMNALSPETMSQIFRKMNN